MTIDPDDPDPQNSASVLGGAGTVYASTDNLYVATQRWPEAQPLVIERSEPSARRSALQPSHRRRSSTASTSATRERAIYAASGEVEGTVLNQWSLSEHDGHLRVATTEDTSTARPARRIESFVTVFDATEPKLKQVGQVGDIGTGRAHLRRALHG